MPPQHSPGEGQPVRERAKYPSAPAARRSRDEAEYQRQKNHSKDRNVPIWAIAIGITLLAVVLIIVFRPTPAPLDTVKSEVQAQPVAAAAPDQNVVTVSHVEQPTSAARQVTFNETGPPKKQSPVPVHPVSGRVTLNGQIAVGAFVVFHPQGEPLPRNSKPFAQVKQDGSFRLSTFSSQDGAPAGEYAVTIIWKPLVNDGLDRRAGDNVMPANMERPETSGLKVTVVAGDNVLPTFELTN